jgi:Domain of unknown function (DUF4440)/Domain of unknown function (DUF3471)
MKQTSYSLALLLLVIGCVADARSQTAHPATTKPTVEAEIRQWLDETYKATLRGDKAFFEQYLAADYFLTNADGRVTKRADELKQITPIPPQLKFTYSIEELTVAWHGDLAFVSYRDNFQFDMPEDKSAQKTQNTLILRRQGKGWQALAEHATRLPKPPVAVKVDPKLYDEYVGEYQLPFDQVRLIITREGDKLMMALSDGSFPKSELTPESDTVFRTRSGAYQRVFVRDAQGRVTHMIARGLDGQSETKLAKVK